MIKLVSKAMLVIVFLFSALAVVTMSAPQRLLVGPVDVQQEWTQWKSQHNKTYTTPEEEANRFQIFNENLTKITEHNKKFEAGEITYSQGLNQFADLNQEEFSKRYLGLKKPDSSKLTGAQ